jgi:tetratricopeptide (TPR) repeat protein
MNLFWVNIVIFLGLVTIVFEVLSFKREQRVRDELSESISQKENMGRKKTRILFLSVFVLLFFAFSIAAFHQRWALPKQGICFVIDPQCEDIGLEKTVISEIVQQFPGTEIGLYEMQNRSVQLVVPLTIDRLFFSLLLDGVEGTPPFDPQSLSEIYDHIARSLPVPPWVVVVTSRQLQQGNTRSLDGLSYVQIRDQKPVVYSFRNGRVGADPSIEALILRIDQQLQLASEPIDIDRIDFLTLALALGIAWVGSIFWRKREVPFFLGMLIASSSSLFSISPEDANRQIQIAKDFMEANDYEQAQKYIEKTLLLVTDPQARRRLFYDLSLVVYLQGRDEEAWNDLHMETTSVDPESQNTISTLEGLILLRLSSHDPQNIWKNKLRSWLASNSVASQELLDRAVLTLLKPEHDDLLSFLIWLEQNDDQTMPWSNEFISTALQYIQQADSATFLKWKKNATLERGGLSRLRIWYESSLVPSPESKIAFLLGQAATLAQEAVIFTWKQQENEETLRYIDTLLEDARKLMPQAEQKEYSRFYTMTAQGTNEPATIWFLRASLWKAVQRQSDQEILAFFRLLCQEIDLPIDAKILERTCAFIRGWVAIPNFANGSEKVCENTLNKLLQMGYLVDPLGAMGEIISLVQSDPARWNPMMAMLMRYALSQKLNEPAKTLGESISKDLSGYDLLILGMLWEQSLRPMKVPQEVPKFLDSTLELFQELLPRLENIQEPLWRTTSLVVQFQPTVVRMLFQASCFSKDVKKRQEYENLLHEFSSVLDDLKACFEDPTRFRLARAQQDVAQIIRVLQQLRALFIEGRQTPAEAPENLPNIESTTAVSFRREDAVRMFQELDRSDRELYGR